MSIKPLTVWGKDGPNPPKVAALLEELGVPYEINPTAISDVKKPEYVAVNPNGRLPALYDPNTDIKIWESGAIIEYLVDKYDPEHKLSFKPGTEEYYHARQYLFYQATGQGPYFGQAVWFNRYHPEKVPSAVERYEKEALRVTAVLESILSQQKVEPGSDGPWLVGGKYSYADLAFVPWQLGMPRVLGGKENWKPEEYPYVKAWVDKMVARPAVKKAVGGWLAFSLA